MAIPPGYATAVWPPSGIAVAALMLGGPRLWPAVWVGSFIANLTIDAALVASSIIATGSTLQALAIAAWCASTSACRTASKASSR